MGGSDVIRLNAEEHLVISWVSEVRVRVRVQDWSGSTDKMTTAATVLDYLLFHLFLTDIQKVGLMLNPSYSSGN